MPDELRNDASFQSGVKRAIGCRSYSPVRNGQLECLLRIPQKDYFHLAILPGELEPWLRRPLRIDIHHVDGADNHFRAPWIEASPQHHWTRLEPGRIPRSLVLVAGTSLPGLLVRVPAVWLTGLATLLWAYLVRPTVWRYWGAVAGFVVTLALAATAGVGEWLSAQVAIRPVVRMAFVVPWAFWQLTLRFAARGLIHPLNRTLLAPDPLVILFCLGGSLLWRVSPLLGMPLASLCGLAMSRDGWLSKDTQKLRAAWRQESSSLLPAVAGFIGFVACNLFDIWKLLPVLAMLWGIVYWRWAPQRDARALRKMAEKGWTGPEISASASEIRSISERLRS